MPRRTLGSTRPYSSPLSRLPDRARRKRPVGGGWYRGPANMTHKEAQAEAIRRWGEGGTATFRPGAKGKHGRRTRYKCVVSSGEGGDFPAREGQGDTWQEAFPDARPR